MAANRKLKPEPVQSTVAGVIRVVDEHGVIERLEVQYRFKTFRYLFDGGQVIDVIAIDDDSYVRGAVLNVTGHDGIVGVAIVEGSDE